jgi:hypothetical protein
MTGDFKCVDYGYCVSAEPPNTRDKPSQVQYKSGRAKGENTHIPRRSDNNSNRERQVVNKGSRKHGPHQKILTATTVLKRSREPLMSISFNTDLRI